MVDAGMLVLGLVCAAFNTIFPITGVIVDRDLPSLLLLPLRIHNRTEFDAYVQTICFAVDVYLGSVFDKFVEQLIRYSQLFYTLSACLPAPRRIPLHALRMLATTIAQMRKP